jgi:hypothetical protein
VCISGTSGIQASRRHGCDDIASHPPKQAPTYLPSHVASLFLSTQQLTLQHILPTHLYIQQSRISQATQIQTQVIKKKKIKNHVVTDKVLRTNLSETQTGHRHRHREVRPERQRDRERKRREETTPTTTTTGIREKPKKTSSEKERPARD